MAVNFSKFFHIFNRSILCPFYGYSSRNNYIIYICSNKNITILHNIWERQTAAIFFFFRNINFYSTQRRRCAIIVVANDYCDGILLTLRNWKTFTKKTNYNNNKTNFTEKTCASVQTTDVLKSSRRHYFYASICLV